VAIAVDNTEHWRFLLTILLTFYHVFITSKFHVAKNDDLEKKKSLNGVKKVKKSQKKNPKKSIDVD